MTRKRAAAFILAAALSCSATGWAGSMEMMGASSRGTAMGGAMVSIADGWEATYYNPSALALSRNSSAVQLSMVSGELLLNDQDTLVDGPGFRFGINRRYLRDRVGLGLVVGTSPSSGGLSLDFGSLMGGGGAPNWSWAMYQDSMPVLLSFGFGFRVTDWLAFGVSGMQKDPLVSMGYFPLVVDPLLESLLGLSTGAIPSNVTSYNFAVGADPDSDYAVGFNVSVRLRYLSLGYVYRPETWARYKLRVELVGGSGSILPDSQFILIDMKIPNQVETTIYGGAAHIPITANDGTLTLSYARETQNWSGFYPSSITYQWDSSQVFGPEWFELAKPRDPGLKDIHIDRYGVEYEGDANFIVRGRLANPRFYVRGGYYHWNSPQPDAQYTWQVAMVDSDADVYSFGMGFGYDRKKPRQAVEDPLSTPRTQIDLHVQVFSIEDRDYRMRADKFQNVPLQNYYVQTSGSITNYGIQVTWWQ